MAADHIRAVVLEIPWNDMTLAVFTSSVLDRGGGGIETPEEYGQVFCPSSNDKVTEGFEMSLYNTSGSLLHSSVFSQCSVSQCKVFHPV